MIDPRDIKLIKENSQKLNMKIFKKLFCPKETITSEHQQIEIGTFWEFVGTGSPFARKYPSVKVLDIKSGWVQYKIGSSTISDLKIEDFLRMYKPKM